MTSNSSSEDFKTEKFTMDFCNEISRVLDVNPSSNYTRKDGTLVTIGEELFWRLNWIGNIFNNPESFNRSVAPAKIRDRIGGHHKKVREALDVLESLNGPVLVDPAENLLNSLIKKQLFEVSDVNPALSGGFVGYDLSFSMSFSNALYYLRQIEGYFDNISTHAKSAVSKQGKNKPGNPFADYMLAYLCQLFRDVTGELPLAYISDTDVSTQAKGRIMEFLEYVLPLLPYPLHKNGVALEAKLRELKTTEIYGWPWSGLNEKI